jgi:hypothetical protein
MLRSEVVDKYAKMQLHATEPFSCEADSRSGSQEMLRPLNLFYSVRDDMPLIPFLSRMNPVGILTPCFFKEYQNIIFPSMPRSHK